MTFAERILKAVATLQAAGQAPVLVTVHPSREFEAAELVGYTVKLDPACPVETVYVE